MMSKRLRSKHLRKQWWDYGLPGKYFITISTKSREQYFGRIENSRMIYSPQGAVAHVIWDEINNHSKRAYTGPFVVMPDHIHGIITLRPIENKSDFRPPGRVKACLGPARVLDSTTEIDSPDCDSDPILDEYLENLEKLMQSNEWPGDKRYQNIGSQTLSSTVGSYKSAVTKHLNRMELNFAWQRLYHDFLITDQNDYKRISKYIKDNPRKWCLKHGING